ncbi:MAG: hypothetical protein CME60_12435 [Halobacteriovoraceae bacterium]|nr:hypothetical protein [Halobacteriovoraceae bacterium]
MQTLTLILIYSLLAKMTFGEEIQNITHNKEKLTDRVMYISLERDCKYPINEEHSVNCFSSKVFNLIEKGEEHALLDMIRKDFNEEHFKRRSHDFFYLKYYGKSLFNSTFLGNVIFRSLLLHALSREDQKLFDSLMDLIKEETTRDAIILSALDYKADKIIFPYWLKNGLKLETLYRYPHFVRWLVTNKKSFNLTKASDVESFFEFDRKRRSYDENTKDGLELISYLLQSGFEYNDNFEKNLVNLGDYRIFHALINEFENKIKPESLLKIFNFLTKDYMFSRAQKRIQNLNISAKSIISQKGETLLNNLINNKRYFEIYLISKQNFLDLSSSPKILKSDRYKYDLCKILNEEESKNRSYGIEVKNYDVFLKLYKVYKKVLEVNPEESANLCGETGKRLVAYMKLMNLPKNKYPQAIKTKKDLLEEKEVVIAPNNRNLLVKGTSQKKNIKINKLLCLDYNFDVLADLRINDIEFVFLENNRSNSLTLFTPELDADIQYNCTYMINLDIKNEFIYPFKKANLISGSSEWPFQFQSEKLEKDLKLTHYKFNKKSYKFIIEKKGQKLALYVDKKEAKIDFNFSCEKSNLSKKISYCYGDKNILTAKDLNGDGILDFLLDWSSNGSKYHFNSLILSNKDGSYKRIKLPMGGC